MRYLLSVFLLGACAQAHDRPDELAACQLISKTGDELAQCLIMKYGWRADSARVAKSGWQWQLDSLRQAHDSQAVIVLAAAARQEAAGLRHQVDSMWTEWEWLTRRTLRNMGYEEPAAKRIIGKFRRHRYEPNTLEVASNGLTVLANMIEARYDTLKNCRAAVAEPLDMIEVSRGEYERAVAIVCS